MSVFDPEKFTEAAPGPGSTVVEPIAAKEYTAIIDDAVIRAAGDGAVLDVTFLLQDEAEKARLGRQSLSVRSGIFLDLTPNGGIDWAKGKNTKLHKLREVLGQNKAGWKYTDLKGAGPLKVQVSLRPDKNSDAVYNDVKSFGKMK